mgnify:CR=1 FL=1
MNQVAIRRRADVGLLGTTVIWPSTVQDPTSTAQDQMILMMIMVVVVMVMIIDDGDDDDGGGEIIMLCLPMMKKMMSDLNRTRRLSHNVRFFEHRKKVTSWIAIFGHSHNITDLVCQDDQKSDQIQTVKQKIKNIKKKSKQNCQNNQKINIKSKININYQIKESKGNIWLSSLNGSSYRSEVFRGEVNTFCHVANFHAQVPSKFLKSGGEII